MLYWRRVLSWDGIPSGVTSWVCQHLFLILIASKQLPTIKDFTLSFSQNHLPLGLLPSLWKRPWNTFPSKTRHSKDSLHLGSTFVHPHTHFVHFIFHHSFALSFDIIPRESDTSLHPYIIHAKRWCLEVRKQQGNLSSTFGAVAGEGKCQTKKVISGRRR